MISLGSLAAMVLPVASRLRPVALPIATAAGGFLIGWLWVGYPNGLADGDEGGFMRGVDAGRAAMAVEYQQQSLDTARAGNAARTQAQDEVRDEMRPIRLPDGHDPERLRELCAADPDCRGQRLFMDRADQLEPR